MIHFFKKSWKLLLVTIVALISYGQTLSMYFWQDDSALMFRLQHPIGQMGSFGPSIWTDSGPYRYMVIPFVPFFKVFGLEPFGYFFVGLILYIIAAFAFYAFAHELFKSKSVSLVSSLVFAAGLVGSDTMFRIINSWQSCMGLILSISTLYFYLRFTKTTKLKDFILALLFYLGSIELVYIRSHSLIASVIALDVLFKIIPEIKLRSIKTFLFPLLRLFPFVTLFYFWYLRDSSFGTPGLISLIKEIASGNISKLMPLFATIGNAMVPNIFLSKLASITAGKGVLLVFVLCSTLFGSLIWTYSKKKLFVFLSILGNSFLLGVSYIFFEQRPFWYSDATTFISGTLGLILTFNIFFLGILTWTRKDAIGRILVLGYAVLASQAFGYYIQYPASVFATTHRYLFFAFIGYSILVPAILLLISQSFPFKSKPFYLLGAGLIALNLILGVKYQSEIVRTRSVPSRIFYKSLLSYVPKIDRDSVFYFDVKENPIYQRQFSDFFSVGSMPESTALAIYYGLDRDDIKYVTNFDELVSMISESPDKAGRTYAFYYGSDGLTDNTDFIRNALGGSKVKVLPKVIKLDDKKSNLEVGKGFKPVMSMVLKFSATTSIGDLSLAKKANGYAKVGLGEKRMSLLYYQSREDYFKSVKLSSLSEWRYQEVFNAADKSTDTSWRGHRIYWDDNEHDYIQMDLGRVERISRVVWVNWIRYLCPISYKIETSLDGKNWQVVKEVSEGPVREGSEKVIEEFPAVAARYVRMDITKTLTNDSPAISEIEVIEADYDPLDLRIANAFLANPFSYVSSPAELNLYRFNFGRLSSIRVTLVTDKGQSVRIIPVEFFNRQVSYSVVIPAGGTEVRSITIEVDDPLVTVVYGPQIENLSLGDMKSLNLIKTFSQN